MFQAHFRVKRISGFICVLFFDIEFVRTLLIKIIYFLIQNLISYFALFKNLKIKNPNKFKLNTSLFKWKKELRLVFESGP
jgi:hypothetical protein